MTYVLPERPDAHAHAQLVGEITEARRRETALAGIHGRREKLVETATLPDMIGIEIEILHKAVMDAESALHLLAEPEPGALDAAKVAAVAAKANMDIAASALREARENLAGVLASLGRFDESVVEFRIALKQAPDDTATRFLLARALIAGGQRDAAAAELREILRLDPTHADAWSMLQSLKDGGVP